MQYSDFEDDEKLRRMIERFRDDTLAERGFSFNGNAAGRCGGLEPECARCAKIRRAAFKVIDGVPLNNIGLRKKMMRGRLQHCRR